MIYNLNNPQLIYGLKNVTIVYYLPPSCVDKIYFRNDQKQSFFT